MDAFYDKLDAAVEWLEQLRLRLVAHPLFPDRKVAYGFANSLVAAAVLKLGLHADDPFVLLIAPAAAGYITSWLVTDGPALEHHEPEDEVVLDAEAKAAASEQD